VGKPNERERERERERYYYSASGKYKSAANTHFQPRKIPHSTKNSPKNSVSKNVSNLYCCTASSVPCFLCQQSFVRTVPYSPETANRNLKSASKTVPKTASISMPNPYGLYCTDPYSTASHSRKIIRPKTHRNFFSRFVPSFLGKRPSLLLTFLSQAYSENLSQSPPDVFSTCLAH
jgi:hypothetical protein